jgi:uncharacterized RDD family membrane protein YckC
VDTPDTAPLWKRVLARGMDYAILMGLWWVLRDYVLLWVHDRTPLLHVVGWGPLAAGVFVAAWLLLLPLPIRILGTSLAKYALGLRAVSTVGSGRVSAWRALAREAFLLPTAFFASIWALTSASELCSRGAGHDFLMMSGVTVLLFALLTGIWTVVKRRKGEYPQDLIGHTRVVQERGVRPVWLVLVGAAALVSLWWVARD